MINENGDVVHEVRFPHPIEQVWKALVDRDALAQWLMPNDFEPRVGHRFRLDGGPPRGLFDAEVVEIDAPNRMRWRWFLDGSASTVTIELHADGDGTVLHLLHTDVPIDPRPNFDSGWIEKLDDLARLLKGQQ